MCFCSHRRWLWWLWLVCNADPDIWFTNVHAEMPMLRFTQSLKYCLTESVRMFVYRWGCIFDRASKRNSLSLQKKGYTDSSHWMTKTLIRNTSQYPKWYYHNIIIIDTICNALISLPNGISSILNIDTHTHTHTKMRILCFLFGITTFLSLLYNMYIYNNNIGMKKNRKYTAHIAGATSLKGDGRA